jgi:type IV fimbrial biogenesis protein FimT
MITSSCPRQLGVLPARCNQGFTLVELMVVVAIMAVLAALAGPSFIGTIERYRVSAVSDQLVSALTLAQTEAIKRAGSVGLARLSGGDCPALATTQEWSCGWQVFIDTNNNGVVNAGEATIQQFRITNGVTVMNGLNSAGTTVNRWGKMNNLGAMRFVISPESGIGSQATTTLCLSSGGRIRKLADSVVCN